MSRQVESDPSARWYVPNDEQIFVPVDPDAAQDVAIALLFREQPAEVPGWQQLLGNWGVNPLLATSDHSSRGSVVFIRTVHEGRERLVAWSFGSAWRWIDKRATDPRFGLLVSLNALSNSQPGELKRPGLLAAHVATTEGSLRDLDLRLGAPTVGPLARLDVTTDQMREVRANTSDDDFQTVAGGRSLQFVAPLDSVASLQRLSDRVVALRDLEEYKAGFAWIENIVPEEDPEVIDSILSEIWTESGQQASNALVEIAWWELDQAVDESSVITHYRAPGEVRKEEIPVAQRSRSLSLTWQGIRAALAHKFPAELPSRMFDKSLRFYNDVDEEIRSVPIRDLVVAQVEINGIQYVLSDGDLLRVQRQFLDSLDDYLTSLVVPPTLPSYRGGDEGSYNTSSGLIVLDRKLVTVGDSRIELCDLVDDHDRMIYVKRNLGKASSLSHLWAQTVASCVLLRRSPDARQKAVDLLETLSPPPTGLISTVRQGTSNLRVVFAILGTRDVRELTLLARVPLRAAAERLQDIGCKVELELIPGP